jgi:type VI secretion system secreted protein Hcp
MFMKLDGITGEAKSYRYKGWSEILSWNWGMTSNRKSAQGLEGDKTSLNELSIIKPVGIDSSSIRSLFARGEILPSVEFSITPAVGKREVQTKYVYIKMEGVVIKSIVTGGSVDDNFFKEHITLLFEKVRFEYSRSSALSDDTTEIPIAESDFAWDVSTNTEWKQ